MPFCLSSGCAAQVDLAPALADEREHLTGDVALHAANGLELGMAIGDALGNVGLRPGLGPKSADGDDVQGAVGGPITAAVQAVAGGLAGGGRDRAHAAQGSKAGLGM